MQFSTIPRISLFWEVLFFLWKMLLVCSRLHQQGNCVLWVLEMQLQEVTGDIHLKKGGPLVLVLNYLFYNPTSHLSLLLVATILSSLSCLFFIFSSYHHLWDPTSAWITKPHFYVPVTLSIDILLYTCLGNLDNRSLCRSSCWLIKVLICILTFENYLIMWLRLSNPGHVLKWFLDHCLSITLGDILMVRNFFNSSLLDANNNN